MVKKFPDLGNVKVHHNVKKVKYIL